MVKSGALLLLLAAFISCKSKVKVDAIFYNATIYTVDSTFSTKQAMAILDGKIVFVGATDELLNNYESESCTDLKGNFMYPGFNDAHCHFTGYAGDMYKCQLTGTKSFDEIIEKLKTYATQTASSFIYGRGWDQNNWPVKQFPNNDLLSNLYTSKPVFLKRIDGHAVLVNKFLLEQAKDVLLPLKNTAFIQTKNGKPTGILFDNAMDAVENVLPKISKQTLIRNLRVAQQECFSLGLTSLTDAGLQADEIVLIDSLQKSGALTIRINAMLMASQKNLAFIENHPFKNTEKLRVQSLKVYADGALGSRGACMKKPYSDEKTNTGKMNTTYPQVDSFATWATNHNYQLCTHAIGDSANAAILNIYAKHLAKNNTLRWRIEHAQVVEPTDVHTFVDYAIIASVQPTHATSDMYWAKERLGNERIKTAYAYGTLYNKGVKLALGTDFPVEYLNPLYTFYAATSRQDDKGFPKNGFQKNDALTRKATLQGMTIDAAYASFLENEIGSLEVGKNADFIICEFDLMKENLLKIRNAKIIATYVAGKKVF